MFRTWSLSWYGRCRLSRWSRSSMASASPSFRARRWMAPMPPRAMARVLVGDLVVDVGGGEDRLGRGCGDRVDRAAGGFCACRRRGVGVESSSLEISLWVRPWDLCRSIQCAGNAGRLPTFHRLPGRDRPPQAREWAMEAKPRGACGGSPGHGQDHHIRPCRGVLPLSQEGVPADDGGNNRPRPARL